MKKIVLTLAILFGSMSALTVNAQDKASTKEKATTESNQKMDRQKAPRYNPFEGLNLTEKQINDLKALKPSKENAQKKEGKKNLSDKDKASKKKLSKAEKQAARKDRMDQRKKSRQDYLAKVKSILTPEQYVKFLENNYTNGGQKMMARHNKMAKMKTGKHARNGKGLGAKKHNNRGKKPSNNNLVKGNKQ